MGTEKVVTKHEFVLTSNNKQKVRVEVVKWGLLMWVESEINEVVDLRRINAKKPLNKTLTSLEFLLVSIAKHLDLKVKQVSHQRLTL